MHVHRVFVMLFGVLAASRPVTAIAGPGSPTSGNKLPYSSLAPADRGFEHLTYTIPKNAVRKGPFGLRSSGLRTKAKQYYLYSDPKTGDCVAREVFILDLANKTSTRVKLELYKNKLMHGVQREWYEDGRPKSIAPYKKWIMHGTFKHWDRDGKVIGWYKIINGKGVRRLYYSNGRLFREIVFRFNREHGPIRTVSSNGYVTNITQKRYGEFFGMSLSFWPDGRFRGRMWSDSEGKIHGPFVENETDPKQKQRSEIMYYVHGAKLSKKGYLAAAEKDSTLPKPRDDPEKYRQIGERTKRIIEHYKKLNRVKIPLDSPTNDTLPFDGQSGRK